MTDFLNMGEEKRSLLVMKNFSWFIYVNSDTVYRHIRDFEISIRSRAEEKAEDVLERIAGGREKLEDALRTHVLREF